MKGTFNLAREFAGKICTVKKNWDFPRQGINKRKARSMGTREHYKIQRVTA